MGKSTISMVIFNSYFDITRGYLFSNFSLQAPVPRFPEPMLSVSVIESTRKNSLFLIMSDDTIAIFDDQNMQVFDQNSKSLMAPLKSDISPLKWSNFSSFPWSNQWNPNSIRHRRWCAMLPSGMLPSCSRRTRVFWGFQWRSFIIIHQLILMVS